jgi:hypothetical protein
LRRRSPSACVVPVARAETVSTRVGKLEFQGSYPSDATIAKLYDERDFQRATQAYLWALPIVGMANWQKAHEEVFGAKSGDVIIYDDFVSKRGILTANATTPYVISFFNLAETGPVVVDMPAGPASPASSTTCGSGPSSTWARPGPTRARAESIC